MLYLSIGMFAVAALLGMYLLSFVLQNKNTPKGVAFTHGPVAALGLVLLIVYGYQHGSWAVTSIVLFTLAALGGIVLILRDLSGKSVPKILALGHGLIATTAFVFLLVFAFK